MEYKGRYILEPYALGGSTRHECPQCHDKKSFTYYIDRYTGKPVDPSVGICNHKNNCQYNVSPSQFFREHPNARPPYYTNENTSGTVPYTLKAKQSQTVFIDKELVLRSHTVQSVFCSWLKSIAPSETQFETAYDDYYLGAMKNGDVVFWLIDTYGNIHEGKIMKYNTDGHRHDKYGVNFIGTKFAGVSFTKDIQIPNDFRQQRDWCLFGEHLLTIYPEKPVCLVESEKTAIVCSMYYPENVWLATGGCSNLNPQIVEPLATRRVIVLPDSGCYKDWSNKLSHSNLTNYTISDALEAYPGNTDIADILLSE